MAMLGMQADMQQNSHFPRRYSSWDLNLDANGSVWSADNVNRIFTNSQYYNGSLPTSSGLSVFNNKDLLKQTMLKHEAQFRDQIHELHRLYRRQKELMGEMKKIDLHTHHLTLETLKSNHILSPKPSNCVEMPQFTSTSLNLMHSHSPASEPKCKIFPLHSSDGKGVLACNRPTCTESSSKAPEFMESNCKKVGKRILDLELPAVFYIDSDEDGSSEVKIAPEVSDKRTNAFKKLPEDRDRVDKKLSNCGSGCYSVFSEGRVVPTNSLREKVLADLNIPIKIEEDTIPELGDSQDPVIGRREASLQDLSEKSNSNFQVLSKEVIASYHIVRDREANLDIDPAIEHRSPAKCTKDFKHVMSVKSFDLNCVLPNLIGCSPEIVETPLHDSELKVVEACSSQDFKRIVGIHTNIPSILSGQCSSHASPARNHQNSSPNKDIKDKEDMVPDIKLEVHHVADRGKQLATAKLVAESDPCAKYPGYEVLIDLNTCLSMDEALQIPSQSKVMDLEPPASPENKESSPPRGESDENQLEIPLLSSGQENVDMQEALIMTAAEALVSISSSEIHTYFESSNYEPFKASGNNSLHWFARLASSVVDDPGTEFGVKIDVKDHSDHEEYLSDGIDYFEAMALNLTDDKVEESLCRSNGQNEDQSATFSGNQTKRGRTRQVRQRRKDFQSEILPSLASLSRYEVTEDLQTIGGLMEAAGARWESGSSRIAGRNGYAKGRRRSNVHASSTTETTMNTMRKQQSVNIEEGIQQRRLMDWGKISRRPRRRRCPSSNPRLILGQV